MSQLKQAKSEKEIKKLTVNAVKVAYNELAEGYNSLINMDKLLCPVCGDWLNAETSFYLDRNYATDRYPICKRCLLRMVEQRKTDKDEPNETKASVQKVLQMMDRPYDDEFYESCVKDCKDGVKERNRNSPFATYITAIQSLPNWRGLTWKDSKFGLTEEGSEDVRLIQKTIRAGRKRFGAGYSDEEYMFLENEYQDWIQRYECNTKAQEEVFENLSICKLLKRKALSANQPTKDIDVQMQQWLDTGNLKPKQNNLDAFSDAQTLGTLLQKFEEEKPLPTLDPELEDVDGLGRYINTFYMGHICKMFGLKNDYAQQYEEEMSKYTVTRPEYTEDGEDEDGINMDKILGVTQDG